METQIEQKTTHINYVMHSMDTIALNFCKNSFERHMIARENIA